MQCVLVPNDHHLFTFTVYSPWAINVFVKKKWRRMFTQNHVFVCSLVQAI